MGKFWEILSGPVTGLIREIGGVIDNLTTTDAEKLEAQRKLTEMTLAFQSHMADVDVEWAKTQASVVTAEAQGSSWLQRNWRPISMLAFVFVILFHYVFGPMFGLKQIDLPPDLWTVVQVGFGGYVFGRTVEKVTPQIADAITSKKK